MGNAVDLSVSVGRITLENPVLAASGTVAFGVEAEHLDLDELGGVVLKTVTPDAREGNPPPRIAETPAGILNAIGLENPGLEELCTRYLPVLSQKKCAILVSIHADDKSELREMAARLNEEAAVTGIEVNLSCPNVAHGTTASDEPDVAHRFISSACIDNGKPVWAKLSPESPDILATARAAMDAGADSLVLANTYRGTAVDWRNSQPSIHKGSGGLSGPAVKPLALFKLAKVAEEIRAPLVASGGAFCAEDVLEFMALGASAVEIGTANFVDPKGVAGIPTAMKELLSSEGKTSAMEMIRTTNIFSRRTAGDS